MDAGLKRRLAARFGERLTAPIHQRHDETEIRGHSNAMVVGCMGVGLSATPVQITGPVGMSQVWDLAGTQNEFNDVRQATPGPTGTRTWMFTHARDWAGWVAALRPR